MIGFMVLVVGSLCRRVGYGSFGLDYVLPSGEWAFVMLCWLVGDCAAVVPCFCTSLVFIGQGFSWYSVPFMTHAGRPLCCMILMV